MMNNLKVCFILIIFVLITNRSQAQTKIIVQIGLSQSKVDMPLLDNAEIREDYTYRQFGATAGLDLRVVESQFFVQFGLHYQMYSSNSMSLQEHDVFNTFSSHSKTHQIKGKIMAGLNLVPKNSIINLYIIGGAQPYYMINQSVGTNDVFYNLNDLERLNVGATYGIGLDLFGRINVEGRQEISLEDYAKRDSGKLKSNILAIGFIF